MLKTLCIILSRLTKYLLIFMYVNSVIIYKNIPVVLGSKIRINELIDNFKHW